DQGDRAQVEGRRVREQRQLESRAQARSAGHVDLEPAATAPYKVVAHVSHSWIDAGRFRRLACALDRAQRDTNLRLAARLRQRLDRMAVAITAREVHARVDARRIAP